MYENENLSEPNTCSVADDSADNQKAREIWGKRLFTFWHSETHPDGKFGDWDRYVDETSKKWWTQTALRFCAECIAPYLKAIEDLIWRRYRIRDCLKYWMKHASDDAGRRNYHFAIDQLMEKRLIPYDDEKAKSEIDKVFSVLSAQGELPVEKKRVSDEAIADEIRAAAMMLLDGVLHAEEWLAAARRVRAKIERKEENKCVSNEELGRIVLTILRGVHHTLDAEYYEDRTYREVGRLLRARLEV